MDFNIILIFIILIFGMLIGFISFFIINPYLRNKIRIQELETKNKQYDLYMQMSPKLAEEEIDNLVTKYVNEYALTEFFSQNIPYIRQQQVDEMIRKLDKLIMLEISDLYIFYIKILVSVNNDDDLLVYIDKKVKEHVLNFITDFNKSVDV